jgi:hypothetical protein
MPRTANLVWLVKNGSRPHGGPTLPATLKQAVRAQSLLRGSGLDVDAIAAEVGYEDGATLRTLLRDRLGRGAATFERICVSAGPSPSDMSAVGIRLTTHV